MIMVLDVVWLFGTLLALVIVFGDGSIDILLYYTHPVLFIFSSQT